MATTKLVLDGNDFRRLPVASKLANTSIGEVFKAGTEIHAEVKFREPSQLVKLGRYMSLLTEDEIKGFEKTSVEKVKKTK